MRADIHDGQEHMLQSETGYIDARPLTPARQNLLQRTAGPYNWVIRYRTRGSRQVRLALISGHAVLEMARQLRDLFNCVNGTVQSWSLNRNLPPDLNDVIVGQAEEVADVNSVALHHGEEPLLPGGQAHAVLAADHRLVAHVIRHVAKIDRAPPRFTGCEQFGNMWTLHEAETRLGAPKIRRDLLDRDAVARRDPRH